MSSRGPQGGGSGGLGGPHNPGAEGGLTRFQCQGSWSRLLLGCRAERLQRGGSPSMLGREERREALCRDAHRCWTHLHLLHPHRSTPAELGKTQIRNKCVHTCCVDKTPSENPSPAVVPQYNKDICVKCLLTLVCLISALTTSSDEVQSLASFPCQNAADEAQERPSQCPYLANSHTGSHSVAKLVSTVFFSEHHTWVIGSMRGSLPLHLRLGAIRQYMHHLPCHNLTKSSNDEPTSQTAIDQPSCCHGSVPYHSPCLHSWCSAFFPICFLYGCQFLRLSTQSAQDWCPTA